MGGQYSSLGEFLQFDPEDIDRSPEYTWLLQNSLEIFLKKWIP